MHGWVVGFGVTTVRRVTPSRYVGGAASDTVPARVSVDVVAQTGGDVTGMLVAGILVVVLGLTAVAIWQHWGSTIRDRVHTGGGSAEESTVGSADDPAGTKNAAPGTVGETERDVAELSDKDVVVDILEKNDGRMKQARIVDRTGWSKSKVSMLLSEMEDEGDISKLRVGRENIISLRGNEPDAASSPFDST
jgi:predicted transcriptional regulator